MSPGGPIGSAGPLDDEPRALEVVQAAAGLPPGPDPAARWERAARAPAPLVREAAPIGLAVATDLLHFSHEARSYDAAASPELADDLRQNVPQALLRDLHRPDPTIAAGLVELEGTQLLGRWKDGRVDIAEALAREPLPRVEAITEVFLEDSERRRQLLAGTWEPHLDDAEPRRHVEW